MADWSRGMTQTWTWCEVNPATWQDIRVLDTVVSASIKRDADAELRESASLVVDSEMLDEIYVRAYLDVEQDDKSERICVGTFLCQTPTLKSDGRTSELTVEAYSPLLELRDDIPPFGYTVTGNIPARIKEIVERASHAPFTGYGTTNLPNAVVANEDDTWLSYARAIAAYANCDVTCDETGRVSMVPFVSKASLMERWVFDDSNSSITLPNTEETFDWYGLPNVCEVVWSEDTGCVFGRAENSNRRSLISTAARGRRVVLRVTNPDELKEGCTQAQANNLARKMLEDASVVERTFVISHGFCPVRIGDCVRINLASHGINTLAQVKSQEIDCTTGATIRSVCVSTERMWSA